MKKFFALIIVLLAFQTANAQWVLQNSDNTNWLFSTYFVNSNIGYVAGGYGMILKTINGGQDWSALNSGTSTDHFYSIFFVNADTGYAVGEPSAFYKTTDGGVTWEKKPIGTNSTLYSVFFTSSDTGYIAGTNQTLGKTTDGGTNWTYQPFYAWTYRSVFFTNPNTGYAVGESVFKKTIDGGANWIQQSGMWGNYLQVYFPTTDTGYIAADSGKIFKTTDAGNTWTPYFTGGVQTLLTMYFTDAMTGYVGGGTTGPDANFILKTNNGGLTWSNQVPANSKVIRSIYFPAKDTGFAIGNNGTIMKTINGGIANVDSYDMSATVNIFPNPTSGYLNIETSSDNELSQISICNLLGQELLRQSLAGKNNHVDISNLNNGIYIIKLTDENSAMLSRIIVKE
ncbi:MAG TPA: YCF48-related protein [Bacteroidales bacterium]|nr:YCF48-related protein [Bacteroidales bacterium]